MKRGDYMKYYHLTNETEVDSVLKNGLTPLIGKNSKSVGETEKRIYLTDYESVKYWSRLLNKNILLEVDMDAEIEDMYQYSDNTIKEGIATYNEFFVYSNIEPSRIRRTEMPKFSDDDVNVSLLINYSYTVSSLCNDIIRYYTKDDDKTFEDEDELIEDIKYTMNGMKCISKPESPKVIKELRNAITEYLKEENSLYISWDMIYNPKYPEIHGLRRCDAISAIATDKKSIGVRKQLTEFIRYLYDDCLDILWSYN